MATPLYRFTDDALIELSDRGVRVFGRWDRRFGCWRLEGGTFRPTDPGRVLDARGIWLSPWPDSGAAAVAAYFTLIPLPVRRRAAPHGPDQWRALEAAWQASRAAAPSM